MAVEGYERLGELEGEWTPSKKDQRRQQEAEDLRRHVQEQAKAEPPPRFSDEQYRTLARIMQTARNRPRSELMRWRLRLFCGHIVERTAHHTHKTIHAAFTTRACEVCGLEPATIVAAEALGRAEQPAPVVSRAPTKTTDRGRIERSIARHEAEAARLRKLLEEDA